MNVVLHNYFWVNIIDTEALLLQHQDIRNHTTDQNQIIPPVAPFTNLD